MTEVSRWLALEPGLLLTAVALLGLVVGSFLNVVVHRLPIMLRRDWQAECADLVGTPPEAAAEPFNLWRPRSRCPHCGAPISALHNIPVLSYLWLRGRCAACGTRISLRYPVVEVLTAALSVAVALRFGVSWQTVGGLALTWILVPLALIDLDELMLPDSLTLPGLWLGVGVNLGGLFAPLEASVLGAILGYGFLWTVYQLFRVLTGKEGMGRGDFKLLGMLGAWLGWQALPVVVLLASLAGAVVGVTLVLARGHDRNVPIPFGPYLAVGGWVALLWGDAILRTYLGWGG
jgi:leader peptidase (prepilin peptidase)/N-methyltransferase